MEKQDKWYCRVCWNGYNYTLAGKYIHLKTKKHQRNVNITNDFLKLRNEISSDDFLKPKPKQKSYLVTKIIK